MITQHEKRGHPSSYIALISTAMRARFAIRTGVICLACAIPTALTCLICYLAWCGFRSRSMFYEGKLEVTARLYTGLWLSLIATLLLLCVGCTCLFMALRRAPLHVGPGVVVEENCGQ